MSLSLAVIEILVHVDELPQDFVAIRAEIPSGVKVEQLRATSLPPLGAVIQPRRSYA